MKCSNETKAETATPSAIGQTDPARGGVPSSEGEACDIGFTV
ncbi:hypothetical protein [Rubripirellula obstinata]|nr:hypothetical protein [Rubripirellula obstinata]